MTTVTEALVDLLNGDATLAGYAPGKAWLDVAPPPARAPRPVMLVALQRAPLDGETSTCTVIVRRFSYLVAVEGTQSQAAAIRSAAARIEALLHRVQWTAAGWHIARSAFVDVVERAYVDGDARLFGVIGTLEVVAEQD